MASVELDSQIRKSWNLLVSSLKESLFMNAGYLISVDAVNSLLGFVFWWVAARIYSPQDIGFASAIISAVILITMISALGIGSGLIRYLPEKQNINEMINTVFLFNAGCSILVGLGFIVGVRYLSTSLVLLLSSFLIMIGFISFILFNTLASSLRMTYVAVREAKYSLIQSLTTNSLRLVLVALLVGFGVWGIVGSLWIAIGISVVLGIFVFLPRALPNYRLELAFSKSDLSRILPFSFGNYIAYLLMQAPARILPIFILEFSSASSAAHAQISWMISGIITTPGFALSTSAFVEASNSPDQSTKIFSKATIPGFLITVLAATLVFLVAPWVLFLFGPSYAVEGVTLLRWLSAAAPLSVLAGFYFSKLKVEIRIRHLIALSAVLASITIGFSVLLTSSLGIYAFGIGWFLGNLMVSIIAVREDIDNPDLRYFTGNIISSLRNQIK